MNQSDLEMRYGTSSFMYTEYPHKTFWPKKPNQTEFTNFLLDLSSINKFTPTLLYIHIPFCHKQCLFCTCHVIIEKNYESIINYINYFIKKMLN